MRWLNLGQAAEYLNVSERTIRRCLEDGEIQYKKFRNCLRISVEALDDYASTSPGNPGKAVAIKFAKKRKFKFVR